MKPSQILKSLPALLTAGRVPFIHGDPGVGKSDVIRAVAAQMGIGLVDLRLSIYDPTDLKGYPTLRGSGANEVMHFVPPATLPRKGKGILLLDELPAAPPSVQAASYQLVLDRRLNEYELPPGWHIVAAGNFPRNGGVHYAMPAALANRFVHIEWTLDHNDWDAWAADNDITAATRAFIRMRPNLLHKIEMREGGQAFPSPRSWKFADDIVKLRLPADTEFELLSGTVSKGVATEYVAMVRASQELPSIDTIVASPTTATLPVTPAGKHAVVVMTESFANADNLDSCITYIERLEKEFQTTFMHGVARTNNRLTRSSKFLKWCSNNQALLGL